MRELSNYLIIFVEIKISMNRTIPLFIVFAFCVSSGKISGQSFLVSSMVKDLVAGSAIVFESRGKHSLKGIPGKWELFLAVKT